jgi:sugar lactone lactonase YvrE
MKNILYVFILLPFFSHAQIITTIAGCGIGDDSLAIKAELFYPHSVAVDTEGNVYIAEADNSRVRKVNTSGIIATIAGNGRYGFSGDGGPGTAAQLSYPSGVTVDRAGNVYVSDQDNSRVRMISTSGIISTYAGNGTRGYSSDDIPATSAELSSPIGLAFDTSGNLFIADAGNFRIRKVDTAGIITTVAGDGIPGYSGSGVPATTTGLGTPYAVAADDKGNLYIADWSNSLILKVDTAGIITTIAGDGTPGYSGDGGPATAASINYHNGVTADTSGNVYFSDAHNSRVRKIDTAGIITTVAGNGIAGYGGDGGTADSAEFCQPSGLTMDMTGNIYIPDDWNNRVRKFTVGGAVTTIAGQNGLFGEGYNAVNAELSVPYNVAVDAAGNIYVADYYNSRIRKIDPVTGDIITTVCGDGISGAYDGYSGDGGPADSARIFFPAAVAVDLAGNLYIADQSNNRIRMVDTSGIITTIAGNGVAGYYGDGGLATAAELSGSYGVAVDNSGNVYVADRDNYRIRKINTSGIISTVAGDGTSAYSADGVSAISTGIDPLDVAVDALGNIYIADGNNNRIRKVDTSGIISTIAGTGIAGFTGDGSLATTAEINGSGGVKADGMGNVFFSDYGNNRVRMINTSGIINTIAGNGAAGLFGDNGLATLAELNGPGGVAIDGSGNVYIADCYNYRIRKVSLSYLSVPAISKVTQENIVIYPNPASTTLTIQSNAVTLSGAEGQITITNLLGQTVFTQNYNSEQVQINVSSLPTGLYFVKVNGSEVRKFVKH